jgi:hypothetical protein
MATNRQSLIAQVKLGNPYRWILEPNESWQIPRDFMITGIAKSPSMNVCNIVDDPEAAVPVNVALDNLNTFWSCNIYVNATENLFRPNIPWIAIPNTPHMYELPTWWYLPMGSSIQFTTTNWHVARITSGATLFRPSIVIFGYFVDEIPEIVKFSLGRPLVLVFQHKPAVVAAAVNPSGTVGLDAATKLESITIPRDKVFFLRKLNYVAITDISAGLPPVNQSNYASQQYCDWTGRLAYNTNFFFHDMTERIDATMTYQDFPQVLKRPVIVSKGNAVVNETTYTAGAPGSMISCLYTIIGGTQEQSIEMRTGGTQNARARVITNERKDLVGRTDSEG